MSVAGRRTFGSELKNLVGSGDRIFLFTAPFLVVAVALNIALPSFFAVGGPAAWLRVAATLLLAAGVAVWAWSVVLILTHVPRGELITTGPYAVVKHPLYTAVALLVIPCAGVLLNTWSGVVVGIAMYAGVRLYATREEHELAHTFGAAWDAYARKVWLACV